MSKISRVSVPPAVAGTAPARSAPTARFRRTRAIVARLFIRMSSVRFAYPPPPGESTAGCRHAVGRVERRAEHDERQGVAAPTIREPVHLAARNDGGIALGEQDASRSHLERA